MVTEKNRQEFKWYLNLFKDSSVENLLFKKPLERIHFRTLLEDCKFVAEESKLLCEDDFYNFKIYPVFSKEKSKLNGIVQMIKIVLLGDKGKKIFSKYYPCRVLKSLATRIYTEISNEKNEKQESSNDEDSNRNISFNITSQEIRNGDFIGDNPLSSDELEIELEGDDVLELGPVNSYPESSVKELRVIGKIGSPEESNRAVFLKDKAWHSLIELSSGFTEIEVGGILIGKAERDRESSRIYLKVTKAIEFESVKATQYSLEVNPQSLASLQSKISSDEQCLGMFHFHPITFEKCKECKFYLDQDKCGLKTTFSSTDISNLENNFSEGYKIGLVLLPFKKNPKATLYGWKDGVINEIKGFYIFKE